MQAIDFLKATAGFAAAQSDTSADKPVRLAVVDPAYVGHPTLPKVTFEGEDTMSERQYAYSYPVKAGDRVALLPVGNTYLIIGAVGGPTTALPVSMGGTGLTTVAAGNYLKGNGTGALVSTAPATVRSDIGANNAANLTTGALPPARLSTAIAAGSVTIVPVANTPTQVTWTYGATLTGTVYAYVTPNTGVPGTTVTGWSVTSPGATSVPVLVTRTNTTSTVLYCLAMGGF